jgi:hypothetical protein
MKHISRLLKIILLGLALGLTQGTSAIPIGPGVTPALQTEAIQPFSFALDGGGQAPAYIATPDGPITISADPSAGIWLKTLPLDDLVGPGLVGPTNGAGGLILGLVEVVTIGEGPAWRDWHESILTDGWEWVTGAIQTMGGVLSLPVITPDFATAIPGLDSTINGRDIAFTFDPLEPGTEIIILKLLECTDSEVCFDEGVVRIAEYPSIPEPTTLALLGLRRLGRVASSIDSAPIGPPGGALHLATTMNGKLGVYFGHATLMAVRSLHQSVRLRLYPTTKPPVAHLPRPRWVAFLPGVDDVNPPSLDAIEASQCAHQA